MNKNKLAVEIARREGGKINLPIAQIKEVIRLVDLIRAEETVGKDRQQTIHRMYRKSKRGAR